MNLTKIVKVVIEMNYDIDEYEQITGNEIGKSDDELIEWVEDYCVEDLVTLIHENRLREWSDITIEEK